MGKKKQRGRVQNQLPKAAPLHYCQIPHQATQAGAKTAQKNKGRKEKNPPQTRKSLFGSFLPQKSPAPAPILVQKAPFSVDSGRWVVDFWFFPENLGFQRHWGRGRPGIAAGFGPKVPRIGQSQRETATPAMANQSKPVWDWESVGGGVNTVNGGVEIPKFQGEPRNSMEGPKIPGKIPKFPWAGPKSGGGGGPKILSGDPQNPKECPQNPQGSPKIPMGRDPEIPGGSRIPWAG